MKVTVVRRTGGPDRFYVVRDDGAEVTWSFPTYGDALPHDAVHYVVEHLFGVKRGFWGRVAAGVDPTRVNEEANRAGGRDKYAAFGDDHHELLLAEALANTPWLDEALDDEACIAAFAASCERHRVAPIDLAPATVARARRVLEALRTQWRSLPSKGALALDAELRAQLDATR